MHIMVVDDNELMRRSLRRQLEADGHTVTLAGDGRQAIRLLRHLGHDVILSDHDLGRGPTGPVILRQAADLQPEARRVLMSGRLCDDPDIRRAVKDGNAHVFIAKPFDADDLALAIGADR